MLWEDGKGSGRKAGVDIRNFGQVTAVIIDDEVHVALNDNVAFSVDTGILTIPVTFSGPVILLTNLEGNRDVLVKATIAVDAVVAGAETSIFRKPTVGTVGLNETLDPRVPLNRNFESGKGAFVTVETWDNQPAGLTGMTNITAVSNGTFGPFPIGEAIIRTSTFILGQNDSVSIQLTADASNAYNATVSLSFYFDTTGAK